MLCDDAGDMPSLMLFLEMSCKLNETMLTFFDWAFLCSAPSQLSRIVTLPPRLTSSVTLFFVLLTSISTSSSWSPSNLHVMTWFFESLTVFIASLKSMLTWPTKSVADLDTSGIMGTSTSSGSEVESMLSLTQSHKKELLLFVVKFTETSLGPFFVIAWWDGSCVTGRFKVSMNFMQSSLCTPFVLWLKSAIAASKDGGFSTTPLTSSIPSRTSAEDAVGGGATSLSKLKN